MRHHHRTSLFLPALAPLFLVAACSAQTKEAPTNTFGEYLAQAHARGQFNGTALVFEKGKIVYEGAFGIRGYDRPQPLDLYSRFRLGSVSKQFTAMAIMILKQDGKLDYDEDIHNFLPELPYSGITIRQLLHHVGGLPDYQLLMDQNWRSDLAYDDTARYITGNADILNLFAELEPPVRFAPGERWEYSNTGYNFLATIVTRASGMPFAQFLKERIFGPAGMSNTELFAYVPGPDPKMPDRAFGYWTDWNGTDRRNTDAHYLNRAAGEDGVYSTVGDLLKWDRILYTDKLVPKSALNEAFTSGVLNNGDSTGYGFGWFIERSPTGQKMVTHSGGWAGFTTYILRGIEEDKCLVLLTNNSTEHFWGLVKGLTALLYHKPATLPPLFIREVMGKEIATEGVGPAIANYRKYRTERPKDLVFAEDQLNPLGYWLLEAGRVDDAVAVFRLNAEEYPGSANVYDSYGDALLTSGDSAQALVNFRKALALDTTLVATRKKADALDAGAAPPVR